MSECQIGCIVSDDEGRGYYCEECPELGRPVGCTLIGPDGFTRLAGSVSDAGNETLSWESAVIAAALASCMAHRTPRQRMLWAQQPCLACLGAAMRPRLVPSEHSTSPAESGVSDQTTEGQR